MQKRQECLSTELPSTSKFLGISLYMDRDQQTRVPSDFSHHHGFFAPSKFKN